ncbi:MAG: serine protease [Actinobacteria bacterium]|nr:serine protease [Actinomycetota bacterium]
MTEIEPEELGPEIRQHQMAERAWQHPSEVGLESRCRVDQRRAVWIAGSVLLAVVALLGTGFALGATRPMEMSQQRQLSTQQASQMSADLAVNQRASLQSEYVAKVTIVSVAESTVATALRFDPQGHLLLPAHLLSPEDEVWAACADGSQEKFEIIASDPASDLAVLRPIEPSAGTSGTAMTTAELPKTSQQVTVFYADPILGVTARVGHLAAGDSAPAADPEMLSGGLVFSPDGAFMGITTLTESRPTGSATTGAVEILVAGTALDVADRLLRT